MHRGWSAVLDGQLENGNVIVVDFLKKKKKNDSEQHPVKYVLINSIISSIRKYIPYLFLSNCHEKFDHKKR